jgi:hypothetical protein
VEKDREVMGEKNNEARAEKNREGSVDKNREVSGRGALHELFAPITSRAFHSHPSRALHTPYFKRFS